MQIAALREVSVWQQGQPGPVIALPLPGSFSSTLLEALTPKWKERKTRRFRGLTFDEPLKCLPFLLLHETTYGNEAI